MNDQLATSRNVRFVLIAAGSLQSAATAEGQLRRRGYQMFFRNASIDGRKVTLWVMNCLAGLGLSAAERPPIGDTVLRRREMRYGP